jgi:hypothetical protein
MKDSCEILNIKDIYVVVVLVGDMTEEYAGKDIHHNNSSLPARESFGIGSVGRLLQFVLAAGV